MQYFGGKSRTWKQICSFLESVREPEQPYFEPFVGGAWVLQGMSGKRIASDANVALITMYKALQNGWMPPEHISREEYAMIKAEQDTNNPLTAVTGFGYSFAAKWFGGYADPLDKSTHLGNPKNTLLKKLPYIMNVEFMWADYHGCFPDRSLVYCDPPYCDTTGYGAVGKFDSAEFWNTMRQWTSTNTVVISEYVAPSDFVCVLEMPTKTEIRNKAKQREPRIERLFMHESISHKANRVVHQSSFDNFMSCNK